MKPSTKARRTTNAKRDPIRSAGTGGSGTGGKRKERVLVEFPVHLLKRADEAARGLETNRSELIRNAVEQLLEGLESKKLERQLAEAYAANADMNRALAEEFAAIDREGF